MEKIIIYTDGACHVHKNQVGGYGAVIQYKDYIKQIRGGELNTTNNRMEIKACIEALKCIKTINIPIEVYSDSQLVVRCFQEDWYNKWIYNNWRSNKKEIKNKDLWKELIDLVSEQENIVFLKVKAHAGIELNELADNLANIGLELTKKKNNIK